MYKVLKRLLIAIMLTSIMIIPFNAVAADSLTDSKVPSGEAMAADAVVVRPLGIVSFVAGFGLFVVSSPFSVLGGNAGDAWHAMVVKPAKFTFKRPLGDF